MTPFKLVVFEETRELVKGTGLTTLPNMIPDPLLPFTTFPVSELESPESSQTPTPFPTI
jgi:hypothetical protein